MKIVWLSPDDVAERIGVSRRTAISLMYQMIHTVIGGTERKRIRVSEDALNAWMNKRSSGAVVQPVCCQTGSRKRLQRR